MRGSGVIWLLRTAALSAPPSLRRRTVVNDLAAAMLAGVILIGGCVTTIAAAAFGGPTAAWTGLGVSIAVLVVAILTVIRAWLHYARFDGLAAGTVAALAAWTVIATASLPAVAGRWIAFADGLGYIALALAILLRRSISPERVTHVLEVRELRTR
ncbi:MAG: hypothetical protein QOG63_1891 [Thermoleophilaceae bacterium]|jgi:hypothetical protein|nr:hypothetical protein [Thermoleophilaceae bacterium]